MFWAWKSPDWLLVPNNTANLAAEVWRDIAGVSDDESGIVFADTRNRSKAIVAHAAPYA